MRIIYLTGSRLDATNSAVNHVLEICANLQRFGHKVKILARGPCTSPLPKRYDLDISFVPVPAHKGPRYFYLQAPFFVLKEMIREHYDFLYSRFCPLDFFSLIIAKKIGSLKYMIELNGPVEEEQKIWGHSQWEIGLAKRLEKFCYRWADGIIVVDSGLRRYLEERGTFRAKLVEIPTGVNPQIIEPLDKKMCHRRLGLDPERRYICFVGSLRIWHGIDIAIKAMKILVGLRSNINLLIVGEGKRKKEYQDLTKKLELSSSVIFAGQVDYEELKYFLGASDICIAPSRDMKNTGYGLAPLKVFDYMAAGRPIVATNVGGLKELIQDNGVGLVADSDDPEEFAREILNLIKDKKKVASLGRRGRYLAENVFSWGNRTRQTEKFLLSVLNRTKTNIKHKVLG